MTARESISDNSKRLFSPQTTPSTASDKKNLPKLLKSTQNVNQKPGNNNKKSILKNTNSETNKSQARGFTGQSEKTLNNEQQNSHVNNNFDEKDELSLKSPTQNMKLKKKFNQKRDVNQINQEKKNFIEVNISNLNYVVNKSEVEVPLDLTILNREPMGHYIPPENHGPLSNLEIPKPGPMDYDPKLASDSFQYSIQGKTNLPNHANQSPGPAAHEILPKDQLFQGGHIGIKLKELKATLNNTPSPFAYNELRTIGKDLSIQKECLSYSISGWYPCSAFQNPGPEQYYPPAKLGENPKWSFGLKPKVLDDITPSPQDYNPIGVKPGARTAPSYTMRPQVGDKDIASHEIVPGPNKYYPRLKWSEKAASLKGWYKETKSLKTPGAANYIIPNNIFQGPQYSLTPKYIEPNSDDVTPGPTDYNPSLKLVNETKPTFSLGERRPIVFENTEGVPSPSAYNPKDRQIKGNDASKVTLKSRHYTKQFSTPGPSDYVSIKPLSKLSAFELARSETRKNRHANNNENDKKPKFNGPGPADYEVKPMAITRKNYPAFSLGKRLAEQKISSTPSANAYSPIVKKGNGIKMKSRMSPFVM
ncbi:hypothetical protein HDU92_008976, partial [Lobulomyces angularis]